MNKKSLLIIIMSVTIALLIAFGTIFLFLRRLEEGERKPEIIEEVDVNKIDYEKLLSYDLGKRTIKIVQTGSKAHWLQIAMSLYVTDDDMLTRIESLQSKIEDVILGIFETKTAADLEGNREVMKQVILENIRDIFVKQADKEKIVDVAITEYVVVQQ